MPLVSPIAELPLSSELQPINDPASGTPEAEMAKLRHIRAADPGAMYWLPQGPDTWAHEIWEHVDAAERRLVAPNRREAEYLLGTAAVDNDVVEVAGVPDGILFSAEHATRTSRLNRVTGEFEMGGFADVGTGGMAAVMAEYHGRALIMNGRQTMPPTDPEHPMRRRILAVLEQHPGFISVHGCSSRAFVRPTDPTGIHAHLGLGIDPTDAEREHAERIVRFGREELGLYVVIGNDQEYYVQTGPDGTLRRNDDGTPYRHRLAAPKQHMTTNVVRRALAEQGRSNVRALQVEMAPLLLPKALDGPSPKDHKAEVIGVALGYRLLEEIAKQALVSAGNSGGKESPKA